MVRTLILAGLLAAPTVACAPTDAGYGGSTTAEACFFPHQVDGFRTASRDTTYVRSRQGDVFALRADAQCFEPAGTRSISVEPFVQARERLCPGDRVRVRVATTSSTPLTCIATVEGPVTDSDVSGFPARDRG